MLEFKVITNTKQLNVTNLQQFEDYLNSELGKRISPVRVVTFLFPWSNVIGVVSLVKLDLKDGTGIVTVEVYDSEYSLEWEAEKLIEKAMLC
jgi:hypothetical protein